MGRRSALAALTLAALTQPALADCTLSGTFLTIKSHDVAADVVEVGRTIVSFMPGGHAVMIDAAQHGIKGYQPFTDARGSWQCSAGGAHGEPFEATLIDFTFPTDASPDAQIARVDLAGTHADEAITGRAVISFFPLDGDPRDTSTATQVIGYDFRGFAIR